MDLIDMFEFLGRFEVGAQVVSASQIEEVLRSTSGCLFIINEQIAFYN